MRQRRLPGDISQSEVVGRRRSRSWRWFWEDRLLMTVCGAIAPGGDGRSPPAARDAARDCCKTTNRRTVSWN